MNRGAYEALDQLRVAKPCPADWSEMVGDDRVRHCSLCKLNVYNLSEMSREEASQLLLNKEGRLCVRYFSRPDGKLMTKDCPKGVQSHRRAFYRLLAGVAFAYGCAWSLAVGVVRHDRPVLAAEDNPINKLAVRVAEALGAVPPRSASSGAVMGDIAAPMPSTAIKKTP